MQDLLRYLLIQHTKHLHAYHCQAKLNSIHSNYYVLKAEYVITITPHVCGDFLGDYPRVHNNDTIQHQRHHQCSNNIKHSAQLYYWAKTVFNSA